MRLALVLVLLFNATALAEEPKGFNEFPWGTGFDEVNEKFFGPKCGGMRALPDDRRPMCTSYELDGIGTVIVGLDFTSGTLQGYAMSVPLPKVHDFKLALEATLGQPTGRTGSGMTWTWPSGTGAVYIEARPMGGLLSVHSKTALDRSGKDVRKGF